MGTAAQESLMCTHLVQQSGPGIGPYMATPLCGRRRRLKERGPELDAVRAVVDPAAAGLDKLAGRDHSGMTDDRDRVALPARLDPQHAETVFVVVEGDAVDETGQDLGRSLI